MAIFGGGLPWISLARFTAAKRSWFMWKSVFICLFELDMVFLEYGDVLPPLLSGGGFVDE